MTTNGERRWKRAWLLVTILAIATMPVWLAPSQTAAQGAAPRHRMTKITETIYRADAPGTPGINATSWVFINDADVLVCGGCTTSSMARRS